MRGLWQGDHLSPLMFIPPIGPLHRLLAKATDAGLLSKLRVGVGWGGGAAHYQISLYADDTTIFIKPTLRMLQT